MLWFFDGSGGESHLWMLSRSCFPEKNAEDFTVNTGEIRR